MGMVNSYDDLRRHIGHDVVIVCYGRDGEAPQNIAIECETCMTVLIDYDAPEEP